MEYQEARNVQTAIARCRCTGGSPDTLLLLEHPPTYTIGYNSDEDNFLVSRQWAAEQRIAIHNVDRGGDVTFHGPGQLVGYPIMKLNKGFGEAVRFIRNLESMLIRALDLWGVTAQRLVKPSGRGYYSGVWVGEQKIGAIGIKVRSDRVTQHGFALNVNTDLTYFDKIIPCGIRGKSVTSLSHLLGREIEMSEVTERVIESFQGEFGVRAG